MKAIQLIEPNVLIEKNLPNPTPSAGEVVIKVKSVGICGTDVGIYRGNMEVKYPIVLGHEFCGYIVGIGDGVTNVKIGDYVISEPSWGCGVCYYCQRGTPSYCCEPRMYGRTCDGALAEYVKSPARIIHKIASYIQPIEAQSVTSIATALRGIKRSNLKVGQSVVIQGPGYSGLNLAQLAKISGASPVIVTGTRDTRLELAKQVGADVVVNVNETNWQNKILEATNGRGPDVVIEATGRPDAIPQAIDMVKIGGAILVFSVTNGVVRELQAVKLYQKDISLIGNKGGYFEYGNAIEFLESGIIKEREMVSHTFSLCDTPQAFDFAINNKSEVMRSVIIFD